MPSLDFIDEILIVDGGSKDKTLEIASKYPKVKVYVYGNLEEREYGARNYGSMFAKGDFLLFLDADVIVKPSCFHLIMKELEKDPNLDCLCLTDKPVEGRLFVAVEWHFYNLIRLLFWKLPGKLKRFLPSGAFIFIRKEAFEKVGRFRVDMNGDGLLGRSLLEGGFKCKLLHGYRHVQVSMRRSFHCGIFEYNLHYLYALENYFPKLNVEFFKKRSWRKSIMMHVL